MSEAEEPVEKVMRLRYAGACRACGAQLAAKEQAIYEKATKTVRCLTHDEQAEAHTAPVMVVDEPVDTGVAGASARREFERRQAKRETRIREKHPKLGGLILALSDDPTTTKNWDTGAVGEERLGKGLDALTSESVRMLHDRGIPGSRANIDHIAVTASGIHVIDAKRYKGRPLLKVEGGFLRPRVEKLLVGNRDCTKLVDGALKQVDVVRAIVGDDVPVRGVLCFVEADWPMIGGSFVTRDVDVLWPKKLYARLKQPGDLEAQTVEALHRKLAAALPPA